MLTNNRKLQDDIRDDAGNVTSPASGLVQGLRAAKIPVCVLGEFFATLDKTEWERRVADVAEARTNQVTVAYYDSVHGLERPVLVGLERFGHLEPDHLLQGVSRGSTFLMMVTTPADNLDNDNTDDSQTPSEDDTVDEDEGTEERQLDTGVSWCRKGFLL